MRREVAGERGAVRLEDGREVLDVGGFVHLAAEAVGNDARTQALAGGVDGGRAARRPLPTTSTSKGALALIEA